MEGPPVTAPMIGRLLGRRRLWAYRQVGAGRFGPIVYRRGKWRYVSLAAVEAYAGHNFTPDQLIAAGVKQPQENP